ncbi:hypothetical protein J6Z39_02810 [bacterium]|nr:hypothetical protein [bacterium]
MKKLFFVPALVLALCAFLFADDYSNEIKRLSQDKKRIADIEKKLSADEKDCVEKPQDLAVEVLRELQIYCDTRESLKNRLPHMKELIADYEERLADFSKECGKKGGEPALCENSEIALLKSAEELNAERENFDKDLEILDSSAKRAKQINEEKNDIARREFDQNIGENLRAKKSLINATRESLKRDEKLFKLSKSQTVSAKNNSVSAKMSADALLKNLETLLKMNAELLSFTQSMQKKVDQADDRCIKKHDAAKCQAIEKEMESLFATANEKLDQYKSEKSKSGALEDDLHRDLLKDIAAKTENAKRTMQSYVKSLEEQNAHLKQRLSTSDNDIEVVKSRNNRQLLKTYTGLVDKMKALEEQSAVFIAFFNEANQRIDAFNSKCTQNRSELSSECRIEGDKIVSEVNQTMEKVSKYANDFNQLNKDLNDFAKKFK